MNRRERILVAVLGFTDALFLPDRRPDQFARHACVCVQRKSFFGEGIAWNAGLLGVGMDEAERRRYDRELASCIGAGLIYVYSPKRSRSRGLRLTDEGDFAARTLAYLPIELGEELSKLHEAATGPRACQHLGNTWASELALAGLDDYSNDEPNLQRDLLELEERMLPLLVRGLAISNADVYGRVWYAITPEGVRLLRHPEDTPSVPAAYPEPRDEVWDYYLDRRKAAWSRIESAPRVEREIGDIPMPCCPDRTQKPTGRRGLAGVKA